MSKRKKSSPIPAVPGNEDGSSPPSLFDDNSRRKITVPVGPRFQAEIPDCMSRTEYLSDTDQLKWCGTQTWPRKDEDQSDPKDAEVGKGRPDTCDCVVPGSIECVRLHIAEKREQLKAELGPVYSEWQFDTMGEESYMKTWKLGEQMKFVDLVKSNPPSQGLSFLKQGGEVLPDKEKKELIDYYFNVYIPRRFSTQTRSGVTAIDTDDEETTEKDPSKVEGQKGSEGSSSSSNDVKATYLVGRR